MNLSLDMVSCVCLDCVMCVMCIAKLSLEVQLKNHGE